MSGKKNVAVVLAGCGVYDGSEIHEATLTLLEIDRQGATYMCFAPDVNQAHVINHITGKEMNESRNVMVEAARIARGNIKPLSTFNAKEFDALIIPGGFGAAKNLSSFAFDGPECLVNEDVEQAVKAMVFKGKPIGALCISPVILSKILSEVTVTIGNDVGTIDAIVTMGGYHKSATHGEIVVDKQFNIVTTPCYMLDASISQIADGAKNIVAKVLELSH